MAYTIYLRTNKVNGMQYVGQTKDFKKREQDWKYLKGKYANNFITEDRNKYGLKNFNVVIIGHCETKEEAYELEEKYIKELGTKYPNGYNIGDGGAGGKGSKCIKLSEETKKKLSDAHKKKVAQYALDGKLIKIWPSAKDVENELGFFQQNINTCCIGGHYNRKKWINCRKAYGYVWKWI